MSDFTYKPRIKDADYYMDALQDVADRALGDATAPVREFLHDEELAATANGEHSIAGLLHRIRIHLC